MRPFRPIACVLVLASTTPIAVSLQTTHTHFGYEKYTRATGKQADFIVLDGNPLDDILNTRKISAVYLRGATLDREALLAKWKVTN